MDYEVIFDIRNAWPPFPSGIIVGVVLGLLFTIARFLPARLDGWLSRYMGAVSGLGPVKQGNPIATLFVMVVPTLLTTVSVLSKKWLWAVGIAAIIASVSLYSFVAARSTLSTLANDRESAVVIGAVSGLRDYYVTNNSSGTNKSYKESFDVAGHHFEYYEDTPGSPYSLQKGSRPFENGHHARITVNGDAIVKVERQLCLVTAPCTVSYLGGVRLEHPLN